MLSFDGPKEKIARNSSDRVGKSVYDAISVEKQRKIESSKKRKTLGGEREERKDGYSRLHWNVILADGVSGQVNVGRFALGV